MLAVERKNSILGLLQSDGRVVVSELAEKFDVSEETIRRDLEKLERDGLVQKSYGGAVLNENAQSDMPLAVRKRTNVIGKQKIAELVSRYVPDNSSIMLDSSSTALFIAKRIKDRKNMVVITNSLEILVELKDRKEWKIFSSGGQLGEDSLALVGSQADKMISCKGFDINKGFTDSNDMHASTKRTMLENCEKRVLAVDSSKFNRIAFNVVGTLSDIDVLVTDVKPADDWLEKFRQYGVKTLYPEE